MENNFESSPTLLRLNQNGQQELARIFMENRTHLRRLVEQRLNRLFLPRLDASDIVQEVYIRAQKKLFEYLASPAIHPIIWLRVLCRDLIAETTEKHCRDKRNPAREVMVGDDEAWIDDLAASSTSVGTTMSKAETIKKIRDALETVSETNREIVLMRHSEKLTFRNIAERLEIRMETAKKRYYRTIAELGQRLN